jgi:L,D-peptidoglycan transpeptidase YkuD (ErfK/YbiS/YcfS/YnhG family)
VIAIEVDSEAGLLRFDDSIVPCQLGRSGTCNAAEKREGDGCTPLGLWPIRAALLRPDRGFRPPATLPWRWIRPSDGWSDDPRDPAYNRAVRHPHPFSAERMWRDDSLYDAVLVLGHNDDPPRPGMGSAIFLHLRGERPTEGCVAIDPAAMQRLLDRLPPDAALLIR